MVADFGIKLERKKDEEAQKSIKKDQEILDEDDASEEQEQEQEQEEPVDEEEEDEDESDEED